VVLRALSRLLIISIFNVMRSANGQKEYLNESNHVKYLRNEDCSSRGMHCDGFDVN
jgi:hypothetical protein